MKSTILAGFAAIALLSGCVYDQYVLRHAAMRADLPLTPVQAGRSRGGLVDVTTAGSVSPLVSHLSTNVGPHDFGPQSEARVRWERFPLSGALQLALHSGENVRFFGGILGGTGLGGYGGFTVGLTDRRFEWDLECAVGGLSQSTKGIYAHEWGDDLAYSEGDFGGETTVDSVEEFAFEDRSIAGWSQIGVTIRSKPPGWGGYAELRVLPRFQLYSFDASETVVPSRRVHLSFPVVVGGGIQHALPSGGRLIMGVRLFQVADQAIPVANIQYTTSLGTPR